MDTIVVTSMGQEYAEIVWPNRPGLYSKGRNFLQANDQLGREDDEPRLQMWAPRRILPAQFSLVMRLISFIL